MRSRPARTRSRRLLVLAAMVPTGCSSDLLPDLIPIPAHVEMGRGVYVLDAESEITLGDPTDAEMRRIVELWAAPVRSALDVPLEIGGGGEIQTGVTDQGPAEGYRLVIDPGGISVLGNDHAGLYYGLQTLAQLLPAEVTEGVALGSNSLEIPSVRIDDSPRFPYRGMHLDVARHFFEPDFVKHYIDLMSRFKFNRFHWHLTEDQGWRIEIDRYPRLTEVGAYRAETHVGHGREPFSGDGQRYGGYYTKEEILDIVSYAQERYVTIVPEIEMPGHSLAALAAYPELACTEGPFEVATTWGVFEDIYCPSEETFQFLENVLSEVIDLFPGDLVHVGGDEAPKVRWEQSELVQRLKVREGLADEHEVQSWFIRRIERFLNANGRRLIGWDEILEGGLAPNATVMSWRGTVGGMEAARLGHDVVMTPYSHLYFDYYQSEDQEGEPLAIGGFLPIDSVYLYEPIPAELAPDEARHILGAQANVWTEYVKTPSHVEYMVFPRLFALSEVVWSPRERRDLTDFLSRVDGHLHRLQAIGVNYRPLEP